MKENKKVPVQTSGKHVHSVHAPKKEEKEMGAKHEMIRTRPPRSQKKKIAEVPAVSEQRKKKTAPPAKTHKPTYKPAPAAVQAPVQRAPRTSAKRGKNARGAAPLRVISLGGLGEIGKNMTLLEWGDSILVIDCGVAFPDEDMLGIDLVIPDITYLKENASRVKGIVITHGHEDHIGSLPYVLSDLNVPVYCTRLTAGIVKNKLKEFRYARAPQLRTVEAGDTVRLGDFSVEFIHVNNSIPDACALAITTPVGVVFHTGDYKLDTTPIDGQMMDLTRIGELGRDGVLLMMGESTNAERPGYTPSESTVGTSFETIFSMHRDKRLVIATFSSNVHRVQQIIDAAVRHNRRVAFLGRSMINVIGAATELGYMHVPEGTIIDISEIKRFKPEQLCLVTTGSQGEPMSALYRMAFGENDRVRLTSQDVVVLSSHPIPGNEKLVGKVINNLTKNGIGVFNTGTLDVHVSGHACQEELKLMLALVRPKFFMPVHGESRHLAAHKELALQMGIPPYNVVISDIGRVLEVTPESTHLGGTVPSGQVLVDGSGVGDVGAVVLRERRLLAEDGIITVSAAISSTRGEILSMPEINTRGFVYMKDADKMMEEACEVAVRTLGRNLTRRKSDVVMARSALRDELQKFFYVQTKRRPVVLPIIIDINE